MALGASRLKVLYATMQFGSGYGQGTERYITNLAGGMLERGHQVTILAGDPEHRRPPGKLGDMVQPQPRTLHYPSRGWMAVQGLAPAELCSLLRQEQPDVVHMVNPAHVGIGMVQAAADMGIPSVATIVDFWWLCPKHTLLRPDGRICDGQVTWRTCLRCIAGGDTRGWVQALARLPVVADAALPTLYTARSWLRGCGPAETRRWRQRQSLLLDTLNTVRTVIFLSQAAEEAIASRLNHQRTQTILCGLEPCWFAEPRVQAQRQEAADPSKLTLAFAGALAAHKGVHLLLEAVRQLGWTDTRVLIAGSGTDQAYEQRIRSLAAGLNVEFVGWISGAEMPRFLRKVDLLVMPSLWPENLPQITLEAAATGVPVLCSRIRGVAEIVPEAMLFEVGSASDLARRLRDWAADPICPPPLQPVSTAADMVTRTLAVYQAALAGRQSPSTA